MLSVISLVSSFVRYRVNFYIGFDFVLKAYLYFKTVLTLAPAGV